MTHYNVGYMDNSHHHQEICVTAENSYDARSIAVEDVPYIHDHPNSIDYVLGIKNERQIRQVAMTNKLMQLKRELHYKCEIGEKNEGYCRGANDYLNRTFDILDEFWQ